MCLRLKIEKNPFHLQRANKSNLLTQNKAVITETKIVNSFNNLIYEKLNTIGL